MMTWPSLGFESPVGSMGVGRSVEGPIASTVSCLVRADGGMTSSSGSVIAAVDWGTTCGSNGGCVMVVEGMGTLAAAARMVVVLEVVVFEVVV